MKYRHHYVDLLCPGCKFPMQVTHRFQPVHRCRCVNEACGLFGREFEVPYADLELREVTEEKRHEHRERRVQAG